MLDVSLLAARLSTAATERTAIAPLSSEYPELDLDAAYLVQRELRSQHGPISGWKLGVTSRAKQAQVGLSSPVYGYLSAVGSIDLGAQLDTSQLIQPRCEPEIVFRIGEDLQGANITAADVMRVARQYLHPNALVEVYAGPSGPWAERAL